MPDLRACGHESAAPEWRSGPDAIVLRPDLLIVGAGPAGMSAAIVAARAGLGVVVVDEQPTPGGQIWRGIEANANSGRAEALGHEYLSGLKVVRAFRQSTIDYRPSTKVWQIESSLRTYVTGGNVTETIEPRSIIIATGAQERPTPFEGWTLPGVMTVGAAQTLLKTPGAIPQEPVWIAGTGPLVLLYAQQLIRLGGEIAGFLDTRQSVPVADALRLGVPAVLTGGRDIAKGLGWYAGIRRHAQRYVRDVVDLWALGTDRVEGVRYRTSDGRTHHVAASLLLVHEGIVPEVHTVRSLGCEIRHDPRQRAFVPILSVWGESSVPRVLVAGDAAGIGGAVAAVYRGRLCASRVVASSEKNSRLQESSAEADCRKGLNRALASRAFLDRLFMPRTKIFLPDAETIVCRCEELRASDLRGGMRKSADSNQLKASTRAGMGPCQGRQCAYTVTSMIAREAGCAIEEVGPFRIRSPLKPITIRDLVSLAGGPAAS